MSQIWISPVVKNIRSSGADGDSYHGYWAQDIYQVNTNFGSAADLVSLSKALHDRGMVGYPQDKHTAARLTFLSI